MATVSSLPPQLQAVLDGLPLDLQEHIERVRVIARELAEGHRLDRDRVDLAAAAHDIARADSDDVLMADALAQGVRITDADRAKPLLLHGPVGAGGSGRVNVSTGGRGGGLLAHDGARPWGPSPRRCSSRTRITDLAKASRYPHIGRVRERRRLMDRAIVEFLRRQAAAERGRVCILAHDGLLLATMGQLSHRQGSGAEAQRHARGALRTRLRPPGGPQPAVAGGPAGTGRGPAFSRAGFDLAVVPAASGRVRELRGGRHGPRHRPLASSCEADIVSFGRLLNDLPPPGGGPPREQGSRRHRCYPGAPAR